MGSNHHLLDLVVVRCVPHFYGTGGDVLFLCVHYPGKGSTSSSPPVNLATTPTVGRQHVQMSVANVVALLDHHDVAFTSLTYMCVGWTYGTTLLFVCKASIEYLTSVPAICWYYFQTWCSIVVQRNTTRWPTQS